MNVINLLTQGVENKASDIFIVAGLPFSCRINNAINKMDDKRLLPPETEELVTQIYALADNRSITKLTDDGDDDFSFAIPGLSRFRVSAYKQRGAISAVIRVITFELPDPKKLGIPDYIINLGSITKGLVLVTGPAGSGKSTTLACMVDKINSNYNKHIITLEDPLEFLHRHKKSVVSQREINVDTLSYVSALRAALRQSPDVILLGEMRDYDTINVAMTAAETGHLIISTLHTIGSANTIDRIIDVFPPNQQHQISAQLSMCLEAVVSQQLIPTVDGKIIPVFEVMTVNPAIRNMIRDNKIHQIDAYIATAANSNTSNMISMDNNLVDLFVRGVITEETALSYATNPESIKKRLQK